MSDQGEPTVITTQQRLEKAEDRERKAAAHRDRLRRVATAEAEVPHAYATGETTKQKLADTYGVSVATIQRILEMNGVQTHRVRHLTDEERKEIASLLGSGTTSLEIQAAYGVSHNTVRKVGLESGVLKPGERKPQRSDEEYARIQELDELARQRFGAGLYNLGVGLRSWEAKKKRETEGTPREQQEAVNEGSPQVSEESQPGQSTPPASPPLSEEEWVNPEPPMQTGVPQFESEPSSPIAEPTQAPSAPAEEPDFKF